MDRGDNPWDRIESDTAESHTHTHTPTHLENSSNPVS